MEAINTNTPAARKDKGAPAPADKPPFKIDFYQISGDEVFLDNRIDGTGWDWSWADWRRDWMDDTASNFAYRCLPLTIANQTGWFVRNPVGFTAKWRGNNLPGNIEFIFDSNPATWSPWINNQFGHGIITWNTPFLVRTSPPGSRLLVIGPANAFKHAVQPLTAIIESDWVSMSFTMNYKFTAAHVPVRFEVGEPLFQLIPLSTNICADLEQATVTYQRLSDAPEIDKSYKEWSAGRRMFHEQKARGEVKQNDWQRDYFTGRDASGKQAAPEHMTRVKPPTVNYPKK